MFNKRFIVTFISLNIILAVGLLFLKNDYVFNYTKNANADTKSKDRITYENYNEVESLYKEKFLILKNTDEEDTNIEANFTRVIEDMDKEVEIEELKNVNSINLDTYKSVIVTSENLDQVNVLQALIDYANDGGCLILAQRPLVSDSIISFKEELGIKSIGNNINTESMILKSNILIQGKGIERNQDVLMSSLDIKLLPNTTVHITDDEDIPLLWENEVGKGKVIVANGQFFMEKINRGLVAGTLSRTDDMFIYPIINSKVLHVDDFPAPIPSGITDEIYEMYGLNNKEFFYDVWWPDVVRITKKYDTKLTGYLVYNYEDKIENLDEYDSKDYKTHLITQGQNLLKAGGEIGLHGFNHQPLRLDNYDKDDTLNYKNWKTSNDMLSAVNELKSFLNEVYPNYEVKAYVPPSNILSEEGRKALKEGVPSLNVISSLYVGSEDDYAYEQEFSKGEDGIYNFPRYYSGYALDEVSAWAIHNGITINGVFSHFIHPDDLLDSKRNYGKLWDELSAEFEEFMEYIYDRFGWLRSMTISQGTNVLDDYLVSESVFSYEENMIKGYMKNNTKEDYFILRSEDKITNSKGCDFEEIDKDIYLIKATEPEFYLETGGR